MADRPERSQPCPEWHEGLAAWVTAGGDPGREAAFVAHLEGCDACRAEVDSLIAVAAVALVADPDRLDAAATGPDPDDDTASGPEPPPDLGERIAARVRAERRGQLGRRAAVVAAGVAAAAAVVIGAVLVAGGDDGPEPLRGEEFAFTVGAGEAVVAPYEGESSVVQLTATGLDPDLTYALWLSAPGGGRDDRVPAGTFRPDDDGTVDVRLPCGMPAGEVGRVWATSPDGQLALDTQ